MKMVCVVFGALLAMTVAACSRSKSSTEGESAPSRPTTVASSEVQETSNYKLVLEKAGPYKKGQQGVVKVVLETKGDFHVNDQYPYKFACADSTSDGVTYPKKIVHRADGAFEKTRAELPVPFIANRAGEVHVGGVFSLSVCTDSNCLMDKRPLEVSVTVEE